MMNKEVPPQDQAYDETEKVAVVLADVAAPLVAAFNQLGTYIAAFGDAFRKAYDARLDEMENEEDDAGR